MSDATVALCGAGMIAQAHAGAARVAGLPVVAVASRTHARAEQLASRLGAQVVDYDALPAGADVVVVSTPPQCHADDAVRMLDAGAAVLLEKPMCRTLDEADRIVAATARNGGRLLYGENLAYAPVVEQLLARVPAVATLTHLEVRSLQGLPTWGDFTSDEWGGGALFDLGVHPLAIAMLVANAAGKGAPVAVDAALSGGEGHGSDEHAVAHLHFADGFVATVESSWQHGPDQEWDVQVAGSAGVVRVEFFPTLRLEVDGDAVPLPESTLPFPLLETLGYTAQLAALVDDTAHAREPAMSASVGRDVLQVVLAAYTSAGHGGERVPLPFRGPRDRTPLQLWRGD